MSTSALNPDNYTGINGVIVGRAAGPAATPKFDKSGTSGLLEIRAAVDQGYKNKSTNEWVDQGTLWVSLIVKDDDPVAAQVGRGDDVRYDDARITAREFDRNNGAGKDWAFEARFGTLSITRTASGGSSGSDDF